MKIVHFIPALRRGGSERMAVQIAQYQRESGHEVHVVVFSEVNEWTEELQGVQVHHFPNMQVQRRRFRSPLAQGHKEFIQWHSNLNPDVIHSHAVWTDIIRFLLLPASAARLHISHMHLYHPTLFDLDKPDPDRGWLFKQYQRNQTQVVTVSERQFRKACRLWPDFLMDQLHVVPNGVQIPENANRSKSGSNLKNVIVVSSLEEHKNIEAALIVFEGLLKLDPNVCLQVAGDGSKKDQLQELGVQLGISDRVEFLGNQLNMDEIYKGADVFLHVSPQETFGLAPLESMAWRTPVVALFPSIPFLIDKENGLLASFPNYTLCAELLFSVLSDSQLVENLVFNGERTAKSYDIQRTFKEISRLYEKCDTL